MTDDTPSETPVNSLAQNPRDPQDNTAYANPEVPSIPLQLRGMAVFFALAGLVVCITLTGLLVIICGLSTMRDDSSGNGNVIFMAIVIALPFYIFFLAGVTASLSVSRMVSSGSVSNNRHCAFHMGRQGFNTGCLLSMCP